MGRVLGTGIKVTVALGVVVGLGLGVWFGSQIALRKSSERELGQAWVAFAKCTVGEAPLAGEAPSVRFRAIELGAGASDWPSRCGVFQANFINASHRAARFGVNNFEEDVPRADLATDIQTFSVTPEQLDKFFKDATTLPTASAAYDLRTVPDAPPPADLVRLAKLKPLAQGPVMASDAVTYGDLRLLFSDRVCWLRASDRLSSATCTPVAQEAGVEHVLATSEDGAPPLILPRGDSGLVRADGTSYVLGQGDPYTIIKKTTDGKTTRQTFGRPMGENVATIQLLGDTLLWTIGTTTDPWGDYYGGGGGFAPYGGYYSVNSFARTLDANGRLGTTTDLGPPWGNDFAGTLSGCRTNEATFLRMKEALLPHLKGQAWGSFVATPRGIEPVADSLVCTGSEAMILGLTDASMGMSSVQQTRCSGTSCSVATVALDAPGTTSVSTVRDLAAITSLGEPIVVARESNGLRVRVARLTDLPSVPDRVLLDGEDGKPGSEKVVHVWLFGRSGPAAVLVLQAEKGTFAFTVEVSGKVTPIDVR